MCKSFTREQPCKMGSWLRQAGACSSSRHTGRHCRKQWSECTTRLPAFRLKECITGGISPIEGYVSNSLECVNILEGLDMQQHLLIDANDTLWENNIYFEQAI